MEEIKNFLKKLVSGTDDVSSKRVASLFVLLNVVILAYIASFKNDGQVPEYMFDALCMVVGGGLGLTALEKIFIAKNESKKNNQPQSDENP